jgi:hypothetical protein
MDIRKIIKEEINDFDWTQEVEPVEPPRIVDSEYGGYNMYLTTSAVRYLLDKQGRQIENERDPKKISWKHLPWKSSGMKYRMDVELYQRDGDKWGVRGRSGDHGWGYSWLTKRHTVGKRTRKQIFNQIMKEFPTDITESNDFEWIDNTEFTTDDLSIGMKIDNFKRGEHHKIYTVTEINTDEPANYVRLEYPVYDKDGTWLGDDGSRWPIDSVLRFMNSGDWKVA